MLVASPQGGLSYLHWTSDPGMAGLAELTGAAGVLCFLALARLLLSWPELLSCPHHLLKGATCISVAGWWPLGSMVPWISSPWRHMRSSARCSSEVRGVGRDRGTARPVTFTGCLMWLVVPGTSGRGSSLSALQSGSDVVACRLTHTVPCAHQKPITALRAAAGRLVTGSQDHTLRVSGPSRQRGAAPGAICASESLEHPPHRRCSVWRTRAASSPYRATQGPSRVSMLTR